MKLQQALAQAIDLALSATAPLQRQDLDGKPICYYCGRPLNGDTHMDHIIPQSKGGRAIYQNLVRSCGTCNRQKTNRDPLEWFALTDMPDDLLFPILGRLLVSMWWTIETPAWLKESASQAIRLWTLSEEERTQVHHLALRRGYVSPGNGNYGNVSGMLRAIAEGALVVDGSFTEGDRQLLKRALFKVYASDAVLKKILRSASDAILSNEPS